MLRIFILIQFYLCLEICLQILSLHPNLEYNIHFPMLRGDLNVHKGLGGSISAVLADLETIWGHCISTILNVPLKDLKVSYLRKLHKGKKNSCVWQNNEHSNNEV